MFLDFRERAPLAASKDMYLDAEGNVIKGKAPTAIWQSACPDRSWGWRQRSRGLYGTQDPAGTDGHRHPLAREGFVLQQGDIAEPQQMAHPSSPPTQLPPHFPETGWQPLRRRRKAGPDRPRSQPGSSYREQGPDAFYKGAIADRIVAASTAKGGLLAKADFEQYAVRELPPVTCDYRGYQVISSPPPSSGGVILCEILNVLELYPLARSRSRSRRIRSMSMIEAMRHAYADRNAALGDPDFVKNPVTTLLDKAYATEDPCGITPSERRQIQRDQAAGARPKAMETTHYSIVDEHGNAVAGHLYAQWLIRRWRRRSTEPASCSTMRWTTSRPCPSGRGRSCRRRASPTSWRSPAANPERGSPLDRRSRRC